VAKKFKFSLESLKKYREQRLLLAKRDMAQVSARHSEISIRIQNCENEARNALGDALSVGSTAAAFLMGASLHEGARRSSSSSRKSSSVIRSGSPT
jgi:hypothetical protein